MDYTPQILKAYFEEVHEDPHGEFSRLTGLTRPEAKVEFYKWSWTRPVLASVMKLIKE